MGRLLRRVCQRQRRRSHEDNHSRNRTSCYLLRLRGLQITYRASVARVAPDARRQKGQMTNLLATIFLTVTTNWVDVARIQPINNGPPGNLLYYPASTQQRGTIITNTVARIKYDGREVDVI